MGRWTFGFLLLSVVGLLLVPQPLPALSEADRLWLLGEGAFADRLYGLSRRTLERFLLRYPQDRRAPEATLLLAKSQVALGAYEAALEGFRKAQRFQPPPGQPQEARFWQGETLFKMKRYQEARGVYQALLDADAAAPQAPDALYGIGWSELELRRREPGVAAFRKLLEVWPDHPTAPSARFYLARTLTELKRYDEAATVLSVFTSRHPGHRLLADAAYLRGWSLVSAGSTAEGVQELKVFLAAYPDHELVPRARRAVVEALLRNGNKTDLLTEYETLRKLPETAEGLYESGLIARKLGKDKDAEAIWLRLGVAFPRHALAAHASLELAEAAFKRNQFKESLALAKKASESGKTSLRLDALLLIGESELRQARPHAALRAFQSAENLEAENPGKHFRAVAGRGLAHEELRQWDAAAKAYEAVVAGSPDGTLTQWAKNRLALLRARHSPPVKARPERPRP